MPNKVLAVTELFDIATNDLEAKKQASNNRLTVVTGKREPVYLLLLSLPPRTGTAGSAWFCRSRSRPL